MIYRCKVMGKTGKKMKEFVDEALKLFTDDHKPKIRFIMIDLENMQWICFEKGESKLLEKYIEYLHLSEKVAKLREHMNFTGVKGE
jgi:hypothetical protein